MSTAVAAGFLLAVGLLLLVTGPHLSHLFADYRSCSGFSCDSYLTQLGNTDRHVVLVGPALIALPAVLGIFLGAPLISREMENGTFRLAWTQGVSRTRWIATRIGLGALVVAVVTGLLTFAFSWWSIPLDHTGTNRIDPSIFGQRGIAPVAYALFAFALGVAAGALVRRALAAMAVTLVGFIAVRMLEQFIVRPHLIAPLHKMTALTARIGVGLQNTSGRLQLVVGGRPQLHGAWVTGAKIVDSAGHAPTSAVVTQACQQMLAQAPPPTLRGAGPQVKQAPPQAIRAFNSCLQNLSTRYHEVIAYQPASRFWELQWIESAIFLGLAALLVALSVYWVRRRLV